MRKLFSFLVMVMISLHIVTARELPSSLYLIGCAAPNSWQNANTEAMTLEQSGSNKVFTWRETADYLVR